MDSLATDNHHPPAMVSPLHTDNPAMDNPAMASPHHPEDPPSSTLTMTIMMEPLANFAEEIQTTSPEERLGALQLHGDAVCFILQGFCAVCHASSMDARTWS